MGLFQEYLANVLLNEMAFTKKKMEQKIQGLQVPINEHLIKILRYKDDLNYNKHFNDIYSWLIDIQDLDFGKAGKKFSKELYFKLLFTEPITSKDNIKFITNKERGKLKDYVQNYEIIRTESEVLEIMHKLLLEVSFYLSQDVLYDKEIEIKRLLALPKVAK